MGEFIRVERDADTAVVTLDRPEILNAWHAPMRAELVAALQELEDDAAVRAIILTGAGDRAFGAGQDLSEVQTFGAEQGEEWMGEWARMYTSLLSLTKPVVAALNGLAVGSAFQVALLCDLRVGHGGVRMGQPEIDSGIPSTTGPWIMREHLGLARTIDLTLTGRLMDADECFAIGLLNRLVPQDEVMTASLELARELGAKPPGAMRLNKQRFKEILAGGLQDAIKAGVRSQRASYASGEPSRLMEAFFAERRARREGGS